MTTYATLIKRAMKRAKENQPPVAFPMEPTPEERKAINTLKRLAKKWPKSLWLFSASGSLCVMRADQDGNHVTLRNGGVDPECVLETIAIPNDGGDW